MYNSLHGEFISAPLLNILKSGINASNPVVPGIETFPMSEYFFQSLFLKLTGAQEQKLKCILWELASNDYQFRYEFLNTKNYGECSDYKDKAEVYKNLIDAIKSYIPDFTMLRIWDDVQLTQAEIASQRTSWETKVKALYAKQAEKIIKDQEQKGDVLDEKNKQKIRDNYNQKALPEVDFQNHLSTLRRERRINGLVQEIIDTLDHATAKTWMEQDFVHFKSKAKKFFLPQYVANNLLLGGPLVAYHKESVYKHRNACAHNTVSYQSNLPTLSSLKETDYKKRNYFFRFTLLILIDEVFVRTYKHYVKAHDT